MDEAALHDLLSGRRSDLAARLLRSGLHVASWGYSSAMSLRNFGYQHGMLKVHSASVPVVSLGNITTGGTGKTPIAAWLANWLVTAGRHPALISRGYRSLDASTVQQSADPTPTQVNDEKLVLDRLCPSVLHFQRKDRVLSAQIAVQQHQCDVLILDDGFQHRRLHRDLDLVLIDALQPWGYGHVLPRGLLREPISSLKRADLILITRADLVSPDTLDQIRSDLSKTCASATIIEVAFRPQQLVDQLWKAEPLERIAGSQAFLFCGIGNPHGFQKMIASLNVQTISIQPFRDHYHYEQRDWDQLAERAFALQADVVLTTQKDLVKLSPHNWSGPPLFAVEIGAELINGGEELTSRLRELLLSNQQSKQPVSKK